MNFDDMISCLDTYRSVTDRQTDKTRETEYSAACA